MQKSKIALIATITALTVGVVNSLGAVIAYSMVVPEPASSGQTLITPNSTEVVVPQLPVLVAPSGGTVTTGTVEETVSQAAPTTNVPLRTQNEKLSAGQAPAPAGVTSTPTGEQVFTWCSGVNPELPDEVCQAIVSIVANPVESNPHLGTKARQSLSLLPKDTSLTMDEKSWQATGANSGSMVVVADTPAYGSLKIKIMLEKQNNIWVLVDGQLAQ